MKQFQAFLREYKALLSFSAVAPLLFLLIFLLYGLPAAPFIYALALYLVLALMVWGLVFYRYYQASLRRCGLGRELEHENYLLPGARDLAEEEYFRILEELCQRIRQIEQKRTEEQTAARDYYTLWVHQIKTPISALRMMLQEEEPSISAGVEAELFRIEQYAEMALSYIRLEDPSSDLSFRHCELDPLIRSSIRKYAPLFISRRLSIHYEGTDRIVLTDEKWLSFLLEQLLSNAVKYTQRGGITISVDEDSRLTIQDTGIGIAAADLPRIFEKGFTGQNGRLDKKATGLGLYLCGITAKRLGIGLRVESRVGEGTAVQLELKKTETTPD